MIGQFTKNISPFVQTELQHAKTARIAGEHALEFQHLESAHVIGQSSTYWHVRVHFMMWVWAIRHKHIKEFFGQIMRMIGAATKTVLGLVPEGNTGGVNVSPFKVMPIKPEHQAMIQKAKQR